MFNLMGLGTASLDTMGGLATYVRPEDLPEGASPRCWDVDFAIGSVITRPGLVSAFSYTTVLQITAYSIYNDIITLYYVGTDPLVNEQFTLGNFTDNNFFLNGIVVTVESVDLVNHIFTAILNYQQVGLQSGLSGTATSLTGLFAGPNVGSLATDVVTPGLKTWTNANGVLANTSPASCTTTLTVGSDPLWVRHFGFSVPSTSGVSGLATTFLAWSSAATQLTVQLLKAAVPVGTPKTITLTTTPTLYTLGDSIDPWGTFWSFANVNNVDFGVQLQSSLAGTTYIQDLDFIVYVTPSLANFNYVKSYIQDDGQIDTLALDANGILWKEDVTNAPGALGVVLTGILPGSYARSATMNQREYICFSDLQSGTERPRVFDGTQFTPLSQVGPGAPPSFVSSVGGAGASLAISNFSITGNVVTFNYTGTEPTAGQLYAVTGAPSPYTYLNFTGQVLGLPAPSPTQFSMELVHADVGSTAVTATATLATGYPIASITQNPEHNNFIGYQWTAGPGSTAPGTILTIYYGDVEDTTLTSAFNSGLYPVNVWIDGLQYPAFPFSKKVYTVVGVGRGIPAGHDTSHYYLSVNVGQTGSVSSSGNTPSGGYWQTIATLTTTTPIPNLNQGDSMVVTGTTPGAWSASWTVVNALKSSVMNITTTQMSAGGTATYGYSVTSGSNPAVGDIVSIQGCTNNSIFNTSGVIATVSGTSAGTFTINGFSSGAIPQAFEASAQATTSGKQFTFDPGIPGSTNNPIYGNDAGTGQVTALNGAVTPVGSGTRQAVVFFITDTGYRTQPSPAVTFTTSSQANYINVGNIPIGPPNVVARGIAFTEAGQNGVPGANFYVINNPVTITVGNNTYVYTSTIINDNTSTNARFTFTDAVLLASEEVDIPGNDLFNLIELGSPAWCVEYDSRMFYGLTLNKVDNFNNLTFDGGYLPNQGGNIVPLGWQVAPGATVTLNTSPVTGQSLYISNTTASPIPQAGMISQSAYRDSFLVPIILPNTRYSVRVAARCPGGIQLGTLTIQLVDNNPGIGFGTVYGSFTVSLTSMSSNIAIFEGNLLTTVFAGQVSANLSLAVFVANLGAGADCEIDRIDIYPSAQPVNQTKVFGSYIDFPESIDASGSGGVIDTAVQNRQPVMGGFVMHDDMYLMKTGSMYSTQDNPNSEPGGWSLHEVSNRVGTIGINSYDVGEEWLVTACRSGIYGFNGGQPVKIMQEIQELWEAINWDYGYTIVLRNDVINRRLWCAVPLPTGIDPVTGTPTLVAKKKWLDAPYNPAPTSPNVLLYLNYQGLSHFDDMVSSPQIHTTMFGTLAAPDMKRKWTIWQIPTPYMDFVVRQNGVIPGDFMICNGIGSSKIYELDPNSHSDDGVAIYSLYTTYGFTNATKSATIPIFGMHAKRYLTVQMTVRGSGASQLRILPNTLDARYPYIVPGGVTLADVMADDIFRPLNIKGNRVFVEFSTNGIGNWFQWDKALLSGKADPFTPINPTGGGNAGVS